MPSGRKHISLDEAVSGMVLTDDLLDANGRILVTQGTTLTDDLIRSLQRHEIADISIASGEISAEDAEAERTRLAERLDYLFRRPPNPDEATGLLELHVRLFRLGESS